MMANGHIRENPPQGYPSTQASPRFARPHGVRSSKVVNSWSKAEILGYLLSYMVKIIPFTVSKICPNFISSWFHWCPTSEEKLEEAEKIVLSNLKKPYKDYLVNIGKCSGNATSCVRTVVLNSDAEETPVVLLHGFACGIGVWLMNLESLSNSRPVYAIDILGFGRSSRPDFSDDALESELQFFISLEKWRKSVGLEKFILLGHSMGGYISASYALNYPERVAHLILVDPWGLPEKPITNLHCYEMDWWVKFLTSFLGGFNFLACVRAVGPAGPYLMTWFRSDLARKYGHFMDDPQAIMDYIYQCNVQHPSGEAAYKVMTDKYGWAKHPMMYRLSSLDLKVPITFVYGSRSWVNRQPGLQIKYSRLNSYVDVQVIEGAGHHVYADKPTQFNDLINEICDSVETGLIPVRNL